MSNLQDKGLILGNINNNVLQLFYSCHPKAGDKTAKTQGVTKTEEKWENARKEKGQ